MFSIHSFIRDTSNVITYFQNVFFSSFHIYHRTRLHVYTFIRNILNLFLHVFSESHAWILLLVRIIPSLHWILYNKFLLNYLSLEWAWDKISLLWTVIIVDLYSVSVWFILLCILVSRLNATQDLILSLLHWLATCVHIEPVASLVCVWAQNKLVKRFGGNIIVVQKATYQLLSRQSWWTFL